MVFSFVLSSVVARIISCIRSRKALPVEDMENRIQEFVKYLSMSFRLWCAFASQCLVSIFRECVRFFCFFRSRFGKCQTPTYFETVPSNTSPNDLFVRFVHSSLIVGFAAFQLFLFGCLFFGQIESGKKCVASFFDFYFSINSHGSQNIIFSSNHGLVRSLWNYLAYRNRSCTLKQDTWCIRAHERFWSLRLSLNILSGCSLDLIITRIFSDM